MKMIKKLIKLVASFFQMKWVKWVLIAVIGVILLSLSISTGSYKSQRNEAQKALKTADSTIQVLRDSLKYNITPVYNYEIHLAVTDQSVYQTKANYNRGTITTPNVKTYFLKVDSSSVSIRGEKLK